MHNLDQEIVSLYCLYHFKVFWYCPVANHSSLPMLNKSIAYKWALIASVWEASKGESHFDFPPLLRPTTQPKALTNPQLDNLLNPGTTTDLMVGFQCSKQLIYPDIAKFPNPWATGIRAFDLCIKNFTMARNVRENLKKTTWKKYW